MRGRGKYLVASCILLATGRIASEPSIDSQKEDNVLDKTSHALTQEGFKTTTKKLMPFSAEDELVLSKGILQHDEANGFGQPEGTTAVYKGAVHHGGPRGGTTAVHKGAVHHKGPR